jgi:predicted RNase H-like HicB family nuclease
MYRFLVVIENANRNYSANSPDLPGCVAPGETREEVEHNMYDAIQMHLRGLREDNMPIPESHAVAEYMIQRMSHILKFTIITCLYLKWCMTRDFIHSRTKEKIG